MGDQDPLSPLTQEQPPPFRPQPLDSATLASVQGSESGAQSGGRREGTAPHDPLAPSSQHCTRNRSPALTEVPRGTPACLNLT